MKGDFDKAPTQTYHDFLNFTTVKSMMEEQLIPMATMVPLLKKEIRTLNSNLKEVAGQTKSAFNELKAFQEEMKQLQTFNARMETIKQDLDYHQVVVKNQNIDFGNKLIEIGQNRDADLQAIEIIRTQAQDQSLKIENFSVNINRNHQKFENIFDEWFKTQNKDSKLLRSKMAELDKRQERVDLAVREHSSKIQKTLDQTIKKIFEDEAAGQFRITALEKKGQMHDKKLINLKKLEMNMEEVLKGMGDSSNHAKFLSETLPILIHLQICESLDKVVGPDYRAPLQVFEMKKLEEIHQYTTRRADSGCIRIMHERLLLFMRFFRKHEKGVFSFTYGEDVHSQMKGEEIGFMHQSYDFSIKKRFDTQHVRQVQFKEALDQALVDPEKQSPIVMKHKLSRLDTNQLLQLRNHIFEHKLRKLDNFDDVYPQQSNPMFGRSSPAPRSRGVKKLKRDESSDSDKKKGTVKGPTFPDKVFVIQREGLKPYNRLNNKFQSLFDIAYKQLKEFKDMEVINFTRATQMTMQVSSELELVKKVVDATLEQLEEHEEKYSNKMVALDKKFDTFNDLLEKKMNKVNKDQLQSFDRFQKIEKIQSLDTVKLEKMEKETIEYSSQLKLLEQSIKKLEEMNSQQMANTKKMIGSLAKQQTSSANQIKKAQIPDIEIGEARSDISGECNHEHQERETSPDEESPEQRGKFTFKSAAKAIQFTNKMKCQGAKQKLKIEAQQKRENAKRIEEQAVMRKQEREIRYEQQALEKNLEAGHDPTISVAQNKALADARAEKKRKKDELVKALRTESKCSKLGQVFLTKLGGQKVENEVKQAKMNERKEKMGIKRIDKSKSGSISKTDIRQLEGDLEEDDENGEFMDTAGIDSMFVNPFAQHRAIDQNQSSGMDMDQLEEYVKPRLDAIWAVIDHNKTTINFNLEKLDKREKESSEKVNTQINENLETLQERINKSMKEINSIILGKEKFEQRVKFDIDQVGEQMEFEKQAILQQRKAMKNEITYEINKITSQNDTARLEFQRINTILERYKDILVLLNQDSMLMQMLQEQEVLDRKQIGLFGLKKNSQILGTNQYSMTNNLLKATGQGQRNTSVGSDQKKFWELRNKDKSYNDVVSAPVDVGENVRGQDKLKTIQDVKVVNAIRQFNQSPISQSGDTQEMNADIFNDPHAGSKFFESTPNSSFMERFESNQQHNTLFVNRDCASCVTGMAPQIITQLKLACLSYVSSPIVYGVGRKNNKLEMQVQDVIQIKEYLLQKCQAQCQELEDLIQILPTTYGTLELPEFAPKSFSNAVEKPNTGGRQTINLDLIQEQMNQIDGEFQIEKMGHKDETSPVDGDFQMYGDISPQVSLKPQILDSAGETLKEQQLTDMLKTGGQEGGLSRGSLKLGNDTHTIQYSRDTSPASPFPIHKQMRKDLIGVEKVQIVKDNEKNTNQNDSQTKPAKKSDQNFLNEVQNALTRLKDMPLSKPKYHVEIIQQFIEAKCQNRSQMSVQNFLQQLLLQKVEDTRQRHEKSHLLKLKSYKLNYAQSRDQRMKESNIFENQVTQSIMSNSNVTANRMSKGNQKSNMKNKTNMGYMHKLPSSVRGGGFGSLVSNSNLKNGLSHIPSISVEAKIKINASLRNKSNSSVQGLNSVNQFLNNQMMSPPNVNRQSNNFATSQPKRKEKPRDILSVSMPYSPYSGLENPGLRTSKNTRYETIDGTEENVIVLSDPADRANLIKSQQFSQNDNKFDVQRRIGTSGGQYPIQSDHEIGLPDVEVNGERLHGRTKSGGHMRRPIPVQGGNNQNKNQLFINSSIGSA